MISYSATTIMPSPIAINDLDRAHLQSARVLESGGSPATHDRHEQDTVEVVISLPREEAQRLFPNGFSSSDASMRPSSPAPHSPPRRSLSSGGSAQVEDSPLSPSISTARSSAVPPPPPPLTILDPPARAPPYEPQPPPTLDATAAGFLEMERSYTNAFHRTLSLFVDDKTFSSPALRAAVVGYLESATTTVLEVLPHHDHIVPDHLRQEIENHVNLVKTVLQRGGVFAEDYLRNRLKKLAAHVPRLETALVGRPSVETPNGRSRLSRLAQPTSEHVSGDPYTTSPQLVEGYSANIQGTLVAAGVPPNGRHQHIHDLLNGPAPPSSSNSGSSRPGPAQIAIPPHNPGRGKTTFVPPSLVPSQGPPPPVRPDDGSPPPILAPFDPRPNPMACLFCRQRKIRCIGHKPHPCEICVKRGFVCSYDWISRRGKRKPKGQDGTALEVPQGSVGVAAAEQTSAVTSSPSSAGGAVSGISPASMGGPDAGSVPQFAFTYHGILVGPPPHGVLPPQQFLGQPPPPGYSLVSPVGAPNTDEGGFPIDPSLVEQHATPQQPPASGRRKGRGSKGAAKEACKSCQDQHVRCEASSSPGMCANCLKGDKDCSWNVSSPVWQTIRQPPSTKTSSPLSTPISAVSTSTTASRSTIPAPPTPITEGGMELDELQEGSADSQNDHSRKRSVSAMSVDTSSTILRDNQQHPEKPTVSTKVAVPIKKKQKVSHLPDNETQENNAAGFNNQSLPNSPMVTTSSAPPGSKHDGTGGGATREVEKERESARLSMTDSPSP